MVEWANTIINSIKKYQTEDNDIAVFGKILNNESDEEFRFVQSQVKNTINELLKMYLRGKYPHKHNSEIKEIVSNRASGYIQEEEAFDIIKYMYNEEDAKTLGRKIKDYYTPVKKEIAKELEKKKLSREEWNLIHEKE
jgi:ribosomal protein L18E